MDQSDCSSNAVNHQVKKGRSSQGKPEWQKSAIRICGCWSEQLSSKGKIYFYNCITEVSQWQKPPEWNLPEISRKDLLKILGDRKSVEENNLKRAHDCISGTTEKHGPLLYDSRKRAKYSGNSEDRNIPTSNSSVYPLSRTQTCVRDRVSTYVDAITTQCVSSCTTTVHESNNKRSKIANCCRNSSYDDMEISPNISPPSGRISSHQTIKCSVPQKLTSDHNPCDTIYHQSVSNKLKSVPPASADAFQKPGSASATLYQLVDAIRASIGGLLEQSPGALSSRVAENNSPSNGSLYGSQKSVDSTCFDRSRIGFSGGLSLATHHKCNTHNQTSSCGPPSSLKPSDRLTAIYPRNDGLAVPSSQLSSRHEPHKPYVSSSNPTARTSSHEHSAYQDTVISANNSTSDAILSNKFNSQNQPTSCKFSSHQMSELLSKLEVLTQASNKHKDIPNLSPSLANRVPVSLKATESSEHTGTKCGGLSTGDHCSKQSNSSCQSSDGISLNRHSRSQHTQLNDLVQVLRTALQQHNTPSQTPSTHSAPSLIPGPSDILNEEAPSASPRDELYPKACYSHNRSKPIPSGINRSVSDIPSSKNDAFADSSPAITCSRSSYSLKLVNMNTNPDTQTQMNSNDSTTVHNSIPISPFHSCNTAQLSSTVTSEPNMRRYSPISQPDPLCTTKTSVLDSVEIQAYIDPTLIMRYQDDFLLRLEQEAQIESKRFDQLQSVLYAELSSESKKLRALVRISEAKLAIHREKQTSLQELMDTIESRKHLPNLSFSDDVL